MSMRSRSSVTVRSSSLARSLARGGRSYARGPTASARCTSLGWSCRLTECTQVGAVGSEARQFAVEECGEETGGRPGEAGARLLVPLLQPRLQLGHPGEQRQQGFLAPPGLRPSVQVEGGQRLPL